MDASYYGHLEVVRTLLEAKADLNAKANVRNQMMMIIIILLLTIANARAIDLFEEPANDIPTIWALCSTVRCLILSDGFR